MSDDPVNRQIDGGDGGGEDGKSIGYGRKAKRMVSSQIKKAKKSLQRNKTKESRHSISRSSGSCCFYLKPTPTLESPAESSTSDPNSSEFTFDSLRGLIEKSDFLSSECNTHLDVHTSHRNDDRS